MYATVKAKLQGEQQVAREAAKLSPLIEKHFKPFDGERALLKNGGRSAKFQKVIDAFRTDCASMTDARIIVDDNYSVAIKIDINQPDPEKPGSGTYYYYHTIYCGQIDKSFSNPTGIYTYEYKMQDVLDYAERVLSVSEKQIGIVAADIAAHKKAIERLQDSIPYQFRELINPR